MTLEQLRIFVAVAERCHVTRAAEFLNMAQSAVSAAVAALEGRHGAKLFHRVGRGISLTEAGTLFLGEAQAVLARIDAAERMLAELAGLKRGTLTVQASQTIASYWLPRHLVAFRRAYPSRPSRDPTPCTTRRCAGLPDQTGPRLKVANARPDRRRDQRQPDLLGGARGRTQGASRSRRPAGGRKGNTRHRDVLGKIHARQALSPHSHDPSP